MNKTFEQLVEFPGLEIYYQKIPSLEVELHEHQSHEVFIPLQGEISVSCSEKIFKAGPGRMLYLPPNLKHSFTSSAPGSGERLIILINNKLWKSHSKNIFSPHSLPINNLAKEIIFYLLINSKTKGSRYFISALVESLVDSLLGEQLHSRSQSSYALVARVKDPRITMALKLIDENIDSMNLATLAKSSGLSLRNLNRLFLKEVNLKPKDFLLLKRIEKAKHLLSTGKMSITDIALEVGYNSLSKFIQNFKKVEGVLPSDYRHSKKK